MLRRRSILLEVCLILLASQVRCKSYGYSDDSAEKSDYEKSDGDEEHAHPDYSKYYSGAAASPKAVKTPAETTDSAGFVNPAEFTSFFSTPITFEASNKKEVSGPQTFFAPLAKDDPLAAFKKQYPQFYGEPTNDSPITKDFYANSEKSEKIQAVEKEDGDADKVEPYYANSFFEDGAKATNNDEVETISPKPNSKKSKEYDGSKDEAEIYKFRTLGEEPFPLKNDKQNVDYNVGKSSSTVSQVPYASGIVSTTSTPYQKYSFRPAGTNVVPKYIEDLMSGVQFNVPASSKPSLANPEAQPSANSPAHLKGCKKMQKPATNDHDAMNCFVCEDPTNKSQYTQCSYTAEPSNPTNYYAASSSYYIPDKQPESSINPSSSSYPSSSSSYRYKRDARRDRSDDPYEIIKERSRSYYDDFERDHAALESERQKDFKYVPDHYEEDDISYSEAQSEEFKKNPDLCKKVEKDGMTCTVCKNEKTGGNFEQCSYTVAPNEQKYAYVAEKKYDSDDPQGESGETEESRDNPQSAESGEKAEESKETSTIASQISSSVLDKDDKEPAESRGVDTYAEYHYDANRPSFKHDFKSDKVEPSESRDDDKYTDYYYGDSKSDKDDSSKNSDDYRVTKHFAASINHEKLADDDESDEKDDYHSYHSKIFPEFDKEESKNDEEQYPAPSEPGKHDVANVLAEFAKKDRSKCKKAEKNGMICYLCIDENKVKHEECMYVADTKPKATHIAYHEMQKYKEPKPSTPEEAEASKNVPIAHIPDVIPLVPLAPLVSTILPAESKRKHYYKKVEPLSIEPMASASEEVKVYTAVKKVSPKVKRRISKKKKSKELQAAASEKKEKKAASSEEHPGPETPEEFKVGQYEGAYSAETKPVYSKIYGSNLPKYMVEKTDFEKEFDSFATAF